MPDSLFDTLVAGGLDHRTPDYRALGFCFSVRTDDAVLVAHLRRLFAPFESREQPSTLYSFGAIVDGKSPLYLLYANETLLYSHRSPAAVSAVLFWHVNREVVAQSQDRLLIHASAVSHRDVALLFPAAMESGKTTLAAGLVRAGLDYLTDETVAIDLTSGLVEPFPRPLSVDRGSWEVLADLLPAVVPGAERYVGGQWQVPPLSIRPDAVGKPSRPRFVITPRYSRGGPTTLSRLSRADAVQLMAEHAFNFRALGRIGLSALVNLVRGADCYRLAIGDLDQACKLVTDLMDTHSERLQPASGTPGSWDIDGS